MDSLTHVSPDGYLDSQGAEGIDVLPLGVMPESSDLWGGMLTQLKYVADAIHFAW